MHSSGVGGAGAAHSRHMQWRQPLCKGMYHTEQEALWRRGPAGRGAGGDRDSKHGLIKVAPMSCTVYTYSAQGTDPGLA